MRKLFFGMSLALVLALTLFPGFAMSGDLRMGARPEGQSDHALLNNGNFPGPDTAIYCGVKTNKAEPYTLHLAASANSSGGTLSLMFRDGDGITFGVPAGGSFSMTQALGGVPEVDDVVRISVGGGTHSAMASVLAVRFGARDPFAGDSEEDNFCITTDDTNPALPGVTLGIPGPNPFPLDSNSHLN